jgi:hypothetical protein
MTRCFRYRAATLLATLAFAGCASLPGIGDLERDAAARSKASLRIVGPDGLLMDEHRVSIERRLKGGRDMGLLARQLEIAEADEVRAEGWAARGAPDRLREWFARRWEYWI